MPERGQPPQTPPHKNRVLVNDRPRLGPRTGVGHYLASVLGAWPQELQRPIGVVDRLTLGRSAPIEPVPTKPESGQPGPLSGVRRVVRTPLSELRPRTDSSVGRGRAVQRRAYAAAATTALRAMRRKGDRIWEPNHHPLMNAREGSPVFTTIHDLSVVQRPGLHPPDRVRAWAKSLPRTLERTSTFIAVSQATARAIERELGVAPERVRTIPLAGRFGEPPTGWTRCACRLALGLDPDRPLAVHLGTIEPRKNLSVLLEAQRIIRQTHSDERTPDLLLIGGPGWGSDAFWGSLAGHPEAGRASCTGYVPDETALALLVAADVVLCPSWLEGFGLPALEAMGAGTPVIVSTDPALTQATGGIAPSVDPADAQGWAREIGRTIEDEPRTRSLIERGLVRAAERSWHDVARDHADLLGA
ncbi:MAG: glycosyltransferase involved in cell wall biosynthesis [Phycisphaerales bacterium]|jgi:glycosyltransferase involved in cell wall biosynthesis